MKNDNMKALLAYLAVCFFWGSTYIAIRIGVADMPPMLFAAIRILLAGGIMIAYAKIKGLAFPKNFRETAKISLVGVLMLTGGTGLLVTAEQWVSASISSVIVASIPLMMAVLEIFIIREQKIRLWGVLGLIIGFSGVVFLSVGGNGLGQVSAKGAVILLIASFFWSVGSVYSKKFKTQSSTVTNIAIQMLAGGAGNLILGLSLGEASRFSPTLNATLALLYLVFFGSIIGYSCYIYILKVWPISKAGTYAYVNPIVAVLLGALILGETITLKIVVSLVIILVGIIIVQKSKT